MVTSVLMPVVGFAVGAWMPLLTCSPLKRASSAILRTIGSCQWWVTYLVALQERRESPNLSAQFNLQQPSQRP